MTLLQGGKNGLTAKGDFHIPTLPPNPVSRAMENLSGASGRNHKDVLLPVAIEIRQDRLTIAIADLACRAKPCLRHPVPRRLDKVTRQLLSGRIDRDIRGP